MQIAILGAGMVGRAIAIDLAKDHSVASFDINEQSLVLLSEKDSSVRIVKTDLSEYKKYPSLLSGFDLVVNAVPGFIGYKTLEAIIQAKKNVVDISFFQENALLLDALAKQNNVTAIVDCGVAPGLSNLILGYHNALMKIDSFECMVGGLPKKRIKPFEYKAPFSPIDIIEEYTRPARYVENGHVVVKPAMSDTELIDFEDAGTLESFNTDGLRSILFTMQHIPDMKEKTLRYPGHIDLMKALFKTGLLDTKEIEIKGNKIRPLDLTSSILFDKWKLGENDEEFTLMKIVIKGILDNRQTVIEYLLYDEYDSATQTHSMSRTTGYTCNAAVNLLANKMFGKQGVFPPELVGSQQNCFEFVLKYLADRNVICRKKILQE